MILLTKFIRHLKRAKRAKSLGFKYIRSANFEVPKTIYVNGSQFALNYPREIGVVNDFLSIFLDDDYLIDRITRPVSTVLDIGANIGFFSIAARKSFSQATIHSYEPNIKLSEYIEPHSEQANFHLYREAVGYKSGAVSLEFIGETNQTRSHTDLKGEVPQTSFSNTIERLGGLVDYAKIDCEGAEWDFFQDFASWQKIRFIAMEYHLWRHNNTHKDVTTTIRDLGFRIIKQTPIDDYGLIYGTRGNI